VRAALRTYGHLLGNRRFMGYVLSNGFAFSNLFVYITGSPQLFIGIFGLSPIAYAWLFGSNAAGVIGLSQLNRVLLRRWSLYQILAMAIVLNLVACLVMVAIAQFVPSVWTMWPALFVALATLGMISPNGAAAALSGEPSIAGSASSLTGTAPYVIGAGAGALLGVLPHTSPISVAGVMALNAVIAFGCHRVLVGRAAAPA
jgi:DHA1 family bicyclomycin/chloramphenicol resistance-like MFS transporter